MVMEVFSDLDEIKTALKIDTKDDFDDKAIIRSFRAANAYVRGAIGPDDDFFNSLNEELESQFDFLVLMLTDHYYYSRSATVENGNLKEYDLGFRSILLQLKAAYRVYEKSVI